jgi:hypothetical protein
MKAGHTIQPGFQAWIGARRVNVVELVDAFAMVQLPDDPRSWVLVAAEVVMVDPNQVRTSRIPDAAEPTAPA